MMTGFLLGAGLLAFFSFRSEKSALTAAKISQMTADWERAKAYTKEYIDASTEASIAFKPKPEMRTFREQMLHLSEANYGLVSAASGKKGAFGFGLMEKTAMAQTKAELTKAVMDSYDFVIGTIKEMDDTKLNGMAKIFDMDMSCEVALSKASEHQTHHRGQTTVYLRLSGITPPQEKLF